MQIFQDNDSPDDILNVDLTRVHYLSGPIHVKGAEPGDLLVVDILDIGPLPDSEWGFTGIFAKENGGGFLTDHFPKAAKAIWKFEGRYATSRHIPGMSTLTQDYRIRSEKRRGAHFIRRLANEALIILRHILHSRKTHTYLSVFIVTIYI
jgi:hypothetical protein